MKLRWLCLTLSLLFTLSLTGCGAKKALPEGVIQIDFWHAMAGPLSKPLKQLVKTFERENPDIRVRSIFQGGYGQLGQKINLALSSNDPPDIAQMYEATIAFCNRSEELVEPLDPYIQRDAEEVQWEDLYPAFRESAVVGGKIYTLPIVKSFPVLYYNKELFREAGIEKAPETWEEFAKFGRKLTKDLDGDGKNDRWGWSFVIDPWIFEVLVLQEGGSMMTPEGTSGLGGEPAKKAMQFLIDASSGPKAYAFRTTGYDNQMDFADRRAAMIIASTVSRSFMADQLDFELGVVPIPRGTKQVSIMSGAGLSIFAKNSKERKEASWRFLKYLATRNATLYWGISTNYIPIRRSATATKDYQKRLEADPGFGAGIAQLGYATSEPPLPSWYECRQVLARTIERSLVHPEKTREVFQAAVKDMNRILREERERVARSQKQEEQ
jgi:sn-glycerol 3-phosphate transport system substrate-binding protein